MNKIGVVMAMVGSMVSVVANATDLEMSAVFGDNMVLQQGMPVAIWGSTAPKREVEVSFCGQRKTAVSDENGKWLLKLAPLKASFTPEKLAVKCGSETKTFQNVLVGEVWLCSGQSNMAFPMKSLANPEAEISQANEPSLRLLDVPRRCQPDPQSTFSGPSWQECSPSSVKDFSAAGYYFGRKLLQTLKVPVGLINCSWPGSFIEPWTPKESFSPEIQRKIEGRSQAFAKLTPADRKRIAEDFGRSDFVKRYFSDRLKDGLPKDAEAEEFFFYYSFWTQESTMYNGLINPVKPYTLRGMLWYQGEQNIKDTDYSMKQQRLVRAWRSLWGEGDFPFYLTQITPIQGGAQPAFWLQQYDAAAKMRNSGIISTVDIGDLHDAHPKNKRDVGERLARLALHDTYGKSAVVAYGPRFKGKRCEGSKLLVEFDNGGSPLATKDGKAPDSFEIAGSDLKFHKAEAGIVNGSSVVLQAAEVARPEHVRFAWTCEALPNFGNAEGLPAFPFCSTAAPTSNKTGE